MITAETLRGFSLFSNLDTAFLEELAKVGEEENIKQDEWVFREGAQAEALYLIVTGRIDLKLNLDPKRSTYATLNTLEEGKALGWSAMVEPYIYQLGAVAAESTRLVRFDGSQLRNLLEQYPEQGYLLMQGIAQAMASRVSMLSGQAPGLEFRFLLASVLLVISIGTGILFVILAFSVIYAAASGHSDGVVMLPFCLVFPVVFFLAARYLYPALFEAAKPGGAALN